jgi:two-component system chemotaxis response regulator CheB
VTAGGGKRPIRVLIVEDSAVVRLLLVDIISRDPRLEVAAAVESAEEALRILASARPDVISLDIRLPGMNGFEATRRIMAERPTPIVVVSASVESEDLKISMNALRAGALSVVEKPVSPASAGYAAIAGRLCRQLVIMSDVPVIRLSAGHRQPQPWIQPSRTNTRTGQAPPPLPAGSYRCLGIVASTGGPNAVATVLQGLGAEYSLPVFLVQHITPSFLAGFVSWLEDTVSMPVVFATEGERPRAGHVYVSPPERHLELIGDRLHISNEAPLDGQRPSGTRLLRSLALNHGPHAMAVVLTGMGDDGAAGLKAIRDEGGFTVAEDESTAVVYGMPAAAARLDAACELLPLPAIGPRLRGMTRQEHAIHVR